LINYAAGSDSDEQKQNMKIFQYIDFLSTFNKRPMDTNFVIAENRYRQKYEDLQKAVQSKQINPEDASKELVADINSILSK
jgi:hypothetical protein